MSLTTLLVIILIGSAATTQVRLEKDVMTLKKEVAPQEKVAPPEYETIWDMPKE